MGLNRSLQNLFDEARTHSHWQNKSVDVILLETIYNHIKFGPTSANCCPLRVVFVCSDEAKEKLKSALFEGNIEKTMSAPVTAIFAYDTQYFNKLDYLFPVAPDAKTWFDGPQAEEHVLRNSSLQAAYFMVVARAYGLDCGPMSGFDKQKIKELFLSDSLWEPNFLCNIGYGDVDKLHPRLPRLSFEEVCTLV